MAAIKEQEKTLFSYTLAQCIQDKHENDVIFKWEILEKGSDKSSRHEITYKKFIQATFKIREHMKTDYHKNLEIARKEELATEIYVKNESKARGVIYTLLQLTEKQKRIGVIAISTGNFASTLCYFGNKFKVPVTVVIPTSSACNINEMFKSYEKSSNITVMVQGSDMLEAHNIALDVAKKKGLCYIDGNKHPDMIVGQATLGIEIGLEKGYKVDAVLLPVTLDVTEITVATAMAIKGSNSNIKVIEARIPMVDSVMNIRSTTYCPELGIPMTRYKMPQSCYKNLIDYTIKLRHGIGHRSEEFNIESMHCFYTGFASYLFSKIIITNGRKHSMVIPLYDRLDLDGYQ